MNKNYKIAVNASVLLAVAALTQACGGGGSSGGTVSSSSSSSASSSSSHNPADITGYAPGATLVANTGTSIQTDSVVAGLSNGNYAVAWDGVLPGLSTDQDVGVRIYSPAGTAVTPEILVNTQVVSYQREPSITALKGGGFVVVWNDYNGVSTPWVSPLIKMQRFDNNGVKLGSETVVNTTTTKQNTAPKAVALADGGFLVDWNQQIYDVSVGQLIANVRGQLFDASGNKRGSELLLQGLPPSNPGPTDVSGLTGGGFVMSYVVTESRGALGAAQGVKVQRYDNNGAPSGAPVFANDANEFAYTSKITGLTNGGFAVAFDRITSPAGIAGIGSQVFDSNNAPVGSEAVANAPSSATARNIYAIAPLNTGGFVTVWSNSGTAAPTEGQVYTTTGTKFLSEFTVESNSDPDRGFRLAGNVNGGFAVSWHSLAAATSIKLMPYTPIY